MPTNLMQFIWWLFTGSIVIIGCLLTRNITSTLKSINENQSSLAKMLNEKIQSIENRQDRLEEAHTETKEKVDNLLGQHQIIMGMGGHK